MPCLFLLLFRARNEHNAVKYDREKKRDRNMFLLKSLLSSYIVGETSNIEWLVELLNQGSKTRPSWR